VIAVRPEAEAGDRAFTVAVETFDAETSEEATLRGTAKACSVAGELAIQIAAVAKTSTRIVAALFKSPP